MDLDLGRSLLRGAAVLAPSALRKGRRAMPLHGNTHLGGGHRKAKVHVIGALASLQNVHHESSLQKPRAAARAVKKAMEASDRKRAQLLHRKKNAQPTTVSARWISGWTPERRVRLRPEAVRVKPPASRRLRQSKSSRRLQQQPEGSRPGTPNSDWFEVGSSRAHSGSWPSWYTTAIDAGAVSADGRIRMAVFHRPSSTSPERQPRPATASASPPQQQQDYSQGMARPKSAGDVPGPAVDREYSAGVSGMLDEAGNWKPREPGDDVFTATVAAVGGMQAHGAATATDERPPSAASLRPRRQPSPLRTRRPASAISVAQGESQPEVVEWLAVAQLSSEELVEEAESLLLQRGAGGAAAGGGGERPISASSTATRQNGSGVVLPVAVVEPESAALARAGSPTRPGPGSGSVGSGAAAEGKGKRAVPRRPWVREEAVAYAVSQEPDVLTLAGDEARADVERTAVWNRMLEERRQAEEAERRRRESGVLRTETEAVRVVKMSHRSYDKGVGYRSLLRPTERADGRPTWGLLEWPTEVAAMKKKTGGDRTTWGS